ncbi:IS1595 family transposase ISClba3 [Paenibacillus sp. CECT 9249]|uniref:transposase n=1 Tax=Paenibacillus sp. CECT 9249 TaxID=2845385 RepID=UPI001E3DC673|nr:transposase [Paenibacillus sp. CECT 9249]CAH0118078.1 IS1595 family transposase ISClba3 [Paenibacillus sp. CECT 9249]
MSELLSFEAFSTFYEKEETCVQAWFDMRWPDGFRCPRCQHPSAYVIKTRRLPLYECQSCRAQTSLIAGTVMEGSRTSLRKWFQAIYLHSRPESVNAVQLARIIGVTYKTAWLICHKLRHAMSQTDSAELLSGLVRISEAIYARRITPPFWSWHVPEQPLLVGASVDDNGTILKLKIEKQEKETIKDPYTPFAVEGFIDRHVEREAAAHAVVTRCTGRRRNLRLISLAWEAEKWLAAVFGGIGSKHLQAYLNQFCYMFNHFRESLLKPLFDSCVKSRTITYRELVGSAAESGMVHYKIAS